MKNSIFSSLDSNIICKYKKDVLPQYPEITYHNHDGYEFYLFLNGNTEYYVEGVGKKLERGDFIIIRPYSFHACNSNKDKTYERIFINLKDTYIRTLNKADINLVENLNKISSSELFVLKFTEEEINRFVAITNEVENNLFSEEYGSKLLVDSLLTQILIMINRKLQQQTEVLKYTSIMPALIKQTINYINNHFTEEISVKRLSQQVGYNSDYLCRQFKEKTGFSIQHYIIAKRITLAKKLLREGTPACDVCFMTGFNNYSNFSRTFKNYEQVSPKEYENKSMKLNV